MGRAASSETDPQTKRKKQGNNENSCSQPAAGQEKRSRAGINIEGNSIRFLKSPFPRRPHTFLPASSQLSGSRPGGEISFFETFDHCIEMFLDLVAVFDA